MSETPNKTNHRCNLHGVSMLKPLEMVQACVIQTLASKIRDLTKFKYWTAPFQLRARVRAWHLWVRTPHHALTNHRLYGFSFSAQELGRLSPVLSKLAIFGSAVVITVYCAFCTITVCPASAAELHHYHLWLQKFRSGNDKAEMCLYAQWKKPSPIKAGDLLNVQKFDWMTWSQVSSVCCLQEQPSNIF